MPCNVIQRKDDGVEFIFWYKNDGVTALYTLDARERHLANATHMRNETYSDRVQFHVTGDVPYLQMDYLREEDTGSYFCRVDYQWSATELKRVNLVVVVPPKRLVIRDDLGQEIRDIAGPYKEKSDVSLYCEAQKGFPSPNVTWWKDNKLWDNTFKKISGNVVNEMRLSQLSRSELFATFHCKAQNTKLSPPITRTIVLDLYLYPVSVKITSKNSALSAGHPVEIVCESAGSRPSAKITWWLNGTHLSDHTETVHDNITSSTLRLLPKLQHHRSPLICRADNPKLFNSHLEDVRLLNVTCGHTSSLPPLDKGRGGSTAEGGRLRPSGVRGGRQPSCIEGGLALQRSASLTQRVSHGHHAPVCRENQQITYVVGLNESVVVRCEVEAQPTDVTFKWEFSNTVHKHYNLQHTSEGVVSNATYMPVTPADYGTLFCWANNSIGHQQSSCFFTVIAPACKTEKSKSNASSSSRDGSEDVWHHSAITAGAGVAASILIVIAVCIYYFRRIYLEKKHRPMGQQILNEEVSIYSRVQCHNTGPQPRILIAK
ncbi:Hemicentin-1 like protein [Argiope bruennichi]|uniref:Hemicentin-1 like protein n=1 Tax=Argiope bruennichi TaxID=94029 RepID=A0A8T0ELL1_ARGBR|nr:Hemicentin-1 like protein [Argiope bruennichi]